MKLQWDRWAYSAVSGFISGGANAITSTGLFAAAQASGWDVQALNLREMGLIWLSAGVYQTAKYLTTNPLPAIETTTYTVETVKTKDTQDEKTDVGPPSGPVGS